MRLISCIVNILQCSQRIEACCSLCIRCISTHTATVTAARGIRPCNAALVCARGTQWPCPSSACIPWHTMPAPEHAVPLQPVHEVDLDHLHPRTNSPLLAHASICLPRCHASGFDGVQPRACLACWARHTVHSAPGTNPPGCTTRVTCLLAYVELLHAACHVHMKHVGLALLRHAVDPVGRLLVHCARRGRPSSDDHLGSLTGSTRRSCQRWSRASEMQQRAS